MRDRRGAVQVETLVAFLPVLTLFLATLQLADLGAASLVVKHASTAAARAAVVVLPDDGAYYGDADNAAVDQVGGLRKADVESAADLILRANARIARADANVSLDKASYAARDDLTATVRARYTCLIPALCGGGIELTGTSKLVYQGARFVYEPTEVGDFGGRPDRGRPGGGAPGAGTPNDGTPVADANDPNDGARDRPPRAAPPREPPVTRPGGDPSQVADNRDPSADPTRKPGSEAAPSKPAAPGSSARPSRPSDTPGAVATAPRPERDRDPEAPGTPADRDDPAPVRPPGSLGLPGGATTVGRPGGAPSPAQAGLASNPPRGPPAVDVTKPGVASRPGQVAARAPGAPADADGCGPLGCTVPGSCFAAGTPVHAERGLVPIEQVREGERVWSRDPATQAIALRPVVRTFVTPQRPLLEVDLATADDGIDTLRVTSEHPFWTARGWVAAGALRRDDRILVRAEVRRAVRAVRVSGSTQTVYNFEVAELHTYLVGAEGAWVHNSCETLGNELTKNDLFTKSQAKRIAADARAARVTREVERLVEHAHAGRLQNPKELEKLVQRMAAADRGVNAHQGFLQEINDALDRMDAGHSVSLGDGADVVDHTAREAVQHKLIGADRNRAEGDPHENIVRRGDFKKLRDNLVKALEQLTGKNGEQPPEGYTHVVDIRVARNAGSPLSRASAAELTQFFNELGRLSREATRNPAGGSANDRLPPMQTGAEVRIRNQNGTYVFRVVGRPGGEQGFVLVSSPE